MEEGDGDLSQESLSLSFLCYQLGQPQGGHYSVSLMRYARHKRLDLLDLYKFE